MSPGNMSPRELMAEVEEIIEDVGAAILATIDEKDKPHMRWMTPAVLKDRWGFIFAITSPHFAKVEDIKKKGFVQWIFQTKSLSKIVTLNGYTNLIDNSSIRSEVLEVIGSRLRVFWNYNNDERDLLVLETVVQSGTFSIPMKGLIKKIDFPEQSNV